MVPDLKITENCLQNIFNTSIPICITNSDYQIVLSNDAYKDIFDMNEQSESPAKCYESRPGPSCQTDACPLKRVLSGEKKVICEPTKVNADGSKQYFIVTARPFLNNQGQLDGIVECFQDITERKRMEEALRKNEEQLHTLLQSIKAAVVVHGPDTKIIKCNKASEELLGLTEDQMLGKEAIDPFWKFCHEDGSDMSLMDYPVNHVINTKKALNNLIIGINRPDKSDVTWVLVNAVPQFDSDENLLQVIVTFMDITEHRQVEHEREKLIKDLQKALTEIKTLKGILPVCCICGLIRDDTGVEFGKGEWMKVDKYVTQKTDAKISHSYCPKCYDKEMEDM